MRSHLEFIVSLQHIKGQLGAIERIGSIGQQMPGNDIPVHGYVRLGQDNRILVNTHSGRQHPAAQVYDLRQPNTIMQAPTSISSIVMGSRNSSGTSPSSSALSCAASKSAVNRRSAARPPAAFSPARSALHSQPNVHRNLRKSPGQGDMRWGQQKPSGL
eukprot:COSAG02_NODE_2808_length_7981_cov_8.763385_2_plen_159_part_00